MAVLYSNIEAVDIIIASDCKADIYLSNNCISCNLIEVSISKLVMYTVIGLAAKLMALA